MDLNTPIVALAASRMQGKRMTDAAASLSELRELGLTVDIDEIAAVRIMANLLIVDGTSRQKPRRSSELHYGGGTDDQRLYATYHVIAKEVVHAGTSNTTLENMIPTMVYRFRLRRGWLPTLDLDTLNRALEGPISEWRGKRLLMATATPAIGVQPENCRHVVEATQEPRQLRDSYLASFPEKVQILDICWAAKQRYREWTRWVGGHLKSNSKPDRAFRAVLTSGKRPEEYRPDPRPKNWK